MPPFISSSRASADHLSARARHRGLMLQPPRDFQVLQPRKSDSTRRYGRDQYQPSGCDSECAVRGGGRPGKGCFPLRQLDPLAPAACDGSGHSSEGRVGPREVVRWCDTHDRRAYDVDARAARYCGMAPGLRGGPPWHHERLQPISCGNRGSARLESRVEFRPNEARTGGRPR